MLGDILHNTEEYKQQDILQPTQEAPLTESELACLQSFVTKSADRIDDDTSLFTGTERKRLAFLQWLHTHGKL